MIRRPPRSTPFPTRRSSDLRCRTGDSRADEAARREQHRRHPDRRAGGGKGRQGREEADEALLARSDRKSTRLNSSHPSISYAVFCLKKKKDNEYRVEHASQP